MFERIRFFVGSLSRYSPVVGAVDKGGIISRTKGFLGPRDE